MEPDNDRRQSTAQHQSFLPPDLLTDDFTTMRDVEDPSVPESSMADVRMDDPTSHLGMTSPTQPPVDTMEPGSPSTSIEYQTAMPSPTLPEFPSRSRSNSRSYSESTTPPGSKRSSAYFADSPNEDLCNDIKRRRRDSHDVQESLLPQPPPVATGSTHDNAPRGHRCRSHSLPDLSSLCRIINGQLDLKHVGPAWRNTRIPSALLLLPSLSADLVAQHSPTHSRRVRDRPIPPPITRLSLRELETPEIMKNAQLIHDIIHDPSLQFRPNLEGPRGERKRLVAEQYWSALEREVDRLKICLRKDPTGLVKLSSNRFPVLFVEMRDILCSLLPVADRIMIEEMIDPEFLCQQLFRGVLDVGNLSRFLGRTMKEHCAPMRDTMVEKMMKQFQYAETSGATDAFVLGLRTVFELLEGMKLDVANHQLRTLKKDLQDRAVLNEREYFEDRIAKGKIDLTAVINWMEPYIEENSTQPFTAFSKAFVDLLSPSSSMQFPATFLFDVPRLNNFRKDFRDLVSVQLCLLLYRELSMSLHPSTTAPPEERFNALRLEIWSILSDLPETTKYTLASPSLAVQIALRALQHSTPNATLPPAHLVTLAQRWIELNVTADSKIFGVAERRVQEYFVEHLVWANGTCIPQTPLRACECEGSIVWAVGTEGAMWLLAERVHRVAAFHWMVFGQVYVKSCEE